MKKLVIPYGVTMIASIRESYSVRLENIFYIDPYDHFDVEEIYLPDTVYYIGKKAFQNLKNLKYIRMSKNVYLLGETPFTGCPKLKNVYLYKSVLLTMDTILSYRDNLSISFEGKKEDLYIRKYNKCYQYFLDYPFFKFDIVADEYNSLIQDYPIDESSDIYFKDDGKDSKEFKLRLLKDKKTTIDYINANQVYKAIKTKLKEITSEIEEEEKFILKEEKLKDELINCTLDLDWDNVYKDSPEIEGVYAKTPAEGLIESIKNLGKVDIEYINALTNYEMKDIIKELKGSIYQDPLLFEETFYKGFKTTDDYLSGNLIKKLKIAKEYNEKYFGIFSDNIKAIEKVLPGTIKATDIYFTLASTWIPKEIIIEFFQSMSSVDYAKISNYITYNEKSSTYSVGSYFNTCFPVRVRDEFNVPLLPFNKLVEKTLNQSDLSMYDSKTGTTSGAKTKKVLNAGNTALAKDKSDLLNEKFVNYCMNHSAVLEKLTRIYNEKFGYNVQRHFDGSFLDFKGLNPNITLFDYQKNAIARILLSESNILLAHDVGTGKTFIVCAAIMELRRMNLSKKNLIVVPNNIVDQWYEIFMNLYKDAKVYKISPNMFSIKNRNEILNNIKNKDYDAIIMAYSSFDLIKYDITDELNALKARIDDLRNRIPKSKMADQLEKDYHELEKTVSPDDILFNDLGINYLFVDEAHNFKNISLGQSLSYISGIRATGSDESNHMLKKVEIVKKNINNKVVFLTGTPITNSITDCYVMQKYLQDSELKLIGIDSFSAWASTFAEEHDEIEIDVDTQNYKKKTRLSRFHNLPELTSLLSTIADFYQLEEIKDIPKFNGYTDVVIDQSADLNEYLMDLTKRCDAIRKGRVSPKDDNLLKITNDGRKAALDLRLVDYEKYKYSTSGKVYECAKNVAQVYFDTRDDRLTQVVFLDQSVHREKEFNLYDELKDLLVNKYGCMENEIAFAGSTAKENEKIFKAMRDGKIRILLGSTEKLGTGVNIQNRLYAAHHLDVPWRPSDMVQREGRIIRQGNINKEIKIFRYVTKSSFDAYSWQILENKQAFINNLLSNSLNERCKEEIQETVLNYAEIKALAIGNPRLKDRADLINELNKCILLDKRLKDKYQDYQKTLLQLPRVIKELTNLRDTLKIDAETYRNNKIEISTDEKLGLIQLIADNLEKHILEKTETKIIDYQGFELCVPPRMIKNNEIVVIKGAGSYIIQVNKEAGIITKIDNYLNKLDEKYNEACENVIKKELEQKDLEYALEHKESHKKDIEKLEFLLEIIDKELDLK